jgi:hypothetical protein
MSCGSALPEPGDSSFQSRLLEKEGQSHKVEWLANERDLISLQVQGVHYSTICHFRRGRLIANVPRIWSYNKEPAIESRENSNCSSSSAKLDWYKIRLSTASVFNNFTRNTRVFNLEKTLVSSWVSSAPKLSWRNQEVLFNLFYRYGLIMVNMFNIVFVFF